MFKSTDNIDLYNKEMDLLIEIDSILKKNNFSNINETKENIEKILKISSKISHPIVAEQLFGITASFPNSYVRSKLLKFVESWIPYESAVEAVVKMTHDPDDMVSFEAMTICGNEKIELSIPYLNNIVGKVSNRHNPGKPVGMGAQIVVNTLLNIFDYKDEQNLISREDYFNNHMKLEDNYILKLDIDNDIKEAFKKLDEPNMIYIEEGYFDYGISENEIEFKDFKWDDNGIKQKVWIPAYYIDEYPVTNKEYDEFCDFVEEYGHIFCHPNEPKNKNHRRNTYYDSRYPLDAPVSGIDFYDAYAYARWKGKTLPSEFQWEKAAKGTDNNIWPWGETFDKEKVWFSGNMLNKDISSVTDWHNKLIEHYYSQSVAKRSEEVNVIRNISSYGVKNMTGGSWEWTKSDYFTRRQFHPGYSNDHLKFNRYSVLKGGSFFSHPGLMYSAFRGKDIPFCRHDEMGFRCVKEIPVHLLRKCHKKPIENKAIY